MNFFFYIILEFTFQLCNIASGLYFYIAEELLPPPAFHSLSRDIYSRQWNNKIKIKVKVFRYISQHRFYHVSLCIDLDVFTNWINSTKIFRGKIFCYHHGLWLSKCLAEISFQGL